MDQIELTKAVAQLSLKMIRGSLIWDIFSPAKPVDVREVQLKLLHDLTQAGIDPALFDLMLSSELDRTLKKQFGVAFFVATVVCTAASFAVIIFNAINHWGNKRYCDHCAHCRDAYSVHRAAVHHRPEPLPAAHCSRSGR